MLDQAACFLHRQHRLARAGASPELLAQNPVGLQYCFENTAISFFALLPIPSTTQLDLVYVNLLNANLKKNKQK